MSGPRIKTPRPRHAPPSAAAVARSWSVADSATDAARAAGPEKDARRAGVARDTLALAADQDALLDATEVVAAGDTAPGPDGHRIARDGIEARHRSAAALAGELASGRFRPGPARSVTIPKGDGGERVIRVPNQHDRVALRSLAGAVRAAAGPGSLSGFDGPGLGRGAAIAALRHAVRSFEDRGVRPVARTLDVAGCFDHLAHDAVAKAAAKAGLADPFLSALRRAWGFTPGGTGVPQGSPLSPVLCDLALTAKLNAPIAAEFGDRVVAVRYVDDLLLVGGRADVDWAAKGCAARVTQLGAGVRFKPVADRAVDPDDPDAGPAAWLGFELAVRNGRVEVISPGPGLLEEARDRLALLRDDEEHADPDPIAREAASEAGCAGGPPDFVWLGELRNAVAWAGFACASGEDDLADVWRRAERGQALTDRLWALLIDPPPNGSPEPGSGIKVEIAVSSVRLGRDGDGGQLWGWRRAASPGVPAGAGSRLLSSTSRTRALLAAAVDALGRLPDPEPGRPRRVRVRSDAVVSGGTTLDVAEAYARASNENLRRELDLLVRLHGAELVSSASEEQSRNESE